MNTKHTLYSILLCCFASAFFIGCTNSKPLANLQQPDTFPATVPSESPTTLAPTASLSLGGMSGNISMPMGSTQVLSWTSTNAVSCMVANGASIVSNQLQSSGIPFGPVFSSTTLSLTCYSSQGKAVNASIAVTVFAPSPSPSSGASPPPPACTLTVLDNNFPYVRIQMALSGGVSAASIGGVNQSMPLPPSNTIVYNWIAASSGPITLQGGVIGPTGQALCAVNFGPPCPVNTLPMYHYEQNRLTTDPTSINHWHAFLEELQPSTVIPYDVGITNLGVFACLPTAASGGALQNLNVLWQPFGDGLYQNYTGYSVNAAEMQALLTAYGITTAATYRSYSSPTAGTVSLYRCVGTFLGDYLSLDANCADIPGPIHYTPQLSVSGSSLLGYVYQRL